MTADITWIHGSRSSRRNTDPPIQVEHHDPDTVVMRQSMAVHVEAPFLYLLFGRDRALLLDTGATADPSRFPLRSIVDGLIEDWLAARRRDGGADALYELVVAHSHAHGDHVAADAQFADRPATTVVGRDVDSVRAFFGFTSWPAETMTFDLGERTLEIAGIPGHHQASIAIYDPATRWLLTGDTVYPGRLYVNDMPAFVDSLDRLVAITQDRQVEAVMGCHIEMSRTPGRDYPVGAAYQPAEAPLPMSVKQLVAVRDATHLIADQPGAHVYDDFAIFNGPCRLAMTRQIARMLAGRLRNALPARAVRPG